MSGEDRRTWLIVSGLMLIFVLHIPVSILLFDVNYDYTLITVTIGGAILGVVSGILGTFAVLRQQSLMGDALSHAALPGVTLAFLLVGRNLGWLLLGAGVTSWLAVLLISALLRTTRIKQDAAMGLVLTAFFAIGLAVLTYIQSRPDANQAGLGNFIFGQAAAIVRGDVLLISVVGLIALSVLMLFWKEFKLITFDPEFASANGFPLRRLDVLLSTLIVVAIVLGLQLAGVILMVGLLIAPAVAARQWTRHLGQMVVLAAAFGAFSGATGAILSAISRGLPTGPMIIVMASSIVLVSITLAPERGLLWALWRRRRDRQRFAAQNVLRDIYHHALRHDDVLYPAPEGMLVALRGQFARLGLTELEKQHVVTMSKLRDETSERWWALTESGVEAAHHDAHNQHLWGLYRRYADELRLPAVVEDHQRDITHLLPASAVAELESILEGGVE